MEKLKFINQQMQILNLPYAFMEWTDNDIPPCYWIGEYLDTTTDNEDGAEECTFILTGTTRGSWTELMEAKNRIKKHFPAVGGLRARTAEGAITVFYESSTTVPTGEADLKRIQINLNIKEWKGEV